MKSLIPRFSHLITEKVLFETNSTSWDDVKKTHSIASSLINHNIQVMLYPNGLLHMFVLLSNVLMTLPFNKLI
jgi:hypothetical protein